MEHLNKDIFHLGGGESRQWKKSWLQYFPFLANWKITVRTVKIVGSFIWHDFPLSYGGILYAHMATVTLPETLNPEPL